MRIAFALISIAMLGACDPGKRMPGGGGGGGGGGDDASPSGSGSACVGQACSATCALANQNHSSVGCEYYAVDMDGASGPPYDACYAVFIANTSTEAAHVNVDWGGQAIDLSMFAKLPVGTGQSL